MLIIDGDYPMAVGALHWDRGPHLGPQPDPDR